MLYPTVIIDLVHTVGVGLGNGVELAIDNTKKHPIFVGKNN